MWIKWKPLQKIINNLIQYKIKQKIIKNLKYEKKI